MTVTWKEVITPDGNMTVEKIHGATEEGCDQILRTKIMGTGSLVSSEKLDSDLRDEVHEVGSN
jgi:hypothetical protein